MPPDRIGLPERQLWLINQFEKFKRISCSDLLQNFSLIRPIILPSFKVKAIRELLNCMFLVNSKIDTGLQF